MHHYRQALLRMRQGDSDRDIAEARIMGRRKAGQWRALAQAHGWLDAQTPLPHDEVVAAALQPPKRASTTVSSLQEHRAKVFGSRLKLRLMAVFGLMAVGVFWLAVEMDNSALQASKSSCSIKP